jgi:transcription elongation GreA/GreB family factor
MLNKGLNKLPQELREVTLVEMPKASRKQEEAINLIGW